MYYIYKENLMNLLRFFILLFVSIQMIQNYIVIKVEFYIYYSGLALEKKGNFGEAIMMYDQALEIDP